MCRSCAHLLVKYWSAPPFVKPDVRVPRSKLRRGEPISEEGGKDLPSRRVRMIKISQACQERPEGLQAGAQRRAGRCDGRGLPGTSEFEEELLHGKGWAMRHGLLDESGRPACSELAFPPS
mmetsp:Transcript_23487/g.52915  ORF Transcript_23487/g.52915 Transcript_23487/m.52915 type:complete len:121 (+) Transcript_23487:40-402(+)